jgi:hypothetical protein
MAADFVLHIVETPEMEELVRKYILITFSSCGAIKYQGYQTFLIESNWFKDGEGEELVSITEHDIYEWHIELLDAVVDVDDVIVDLTNEEESLIWNTPSIEIGEVSWLKAALLEDDDYIPETIFLIRNLVDVEYPELVTIDDEFVEEVRKAFEISNTTNYRLKDSESVVQFLRKYKGKKVFHISW